MLVTTNTEAKMVPAVEAVDVVGTVAPPGPSKTGCGSVSRPPLGQY